MEKRKESRKEYKQSVDNGYVLIALSKLLNREKRRLEMVSLTNNAIRIIQACYKPEKSIPDFNENVMAIRQQWGRHVSREFTRMSKRARKLYDKKGPFEWMFQFTQFATPCAPCGGTANKCFCAKTHHPGVSYFFR